VVVVFVVSKASASLTWRVATGFVVPRPTFPVDGLNVSFVEETPTFVETPEVTSSNVI